MSIRTLLTLHEGRKNKVYRCPAGKRTIGVGHNIEAKGLPNDIYDYLDKHGIITEKMIDQLLDQDIEDALTDALVIYPKLNTYSIGRQEALIDFVFNVGAETAKTFKATNLAIQNEDWAGAAEQMKKSKWFWQVHQRGVRITNMIKNGNSYEV